MKTQLLSEGHSAPLEEAKVRVRFFLENLGERPREIKVKLPVCYSLGCFCDAAMKEDGCYAISFPDAIRQITATIAHDCKHFFEQTKLDFSPAMGAQLSLMLDALENGGRYMFFNRFYSRDFVVRLVANIPCAGDFSSSAWAEPVNKLKIGAGFFIENACVALEILRQTGKVGNPSQEGAQRD